MARQSGLYSITAKVIGKKRRCRCGHKVGDAFEISCLDAGNMCGWLYHDLFPHLLTFEHGGDLPWWNGDVIEEYDCPDRTNQVKIRLERVKR